MLSFKLIICGQTIKESPNSGLDYPMFHQTPSWNTAYIMKNDILINDSYAYLNSFGLFPLLVSDLSTNLESRVWTIFVQYQNFFTPEQNLRLVLDQEYQYTLQIILSISLKNLPSDLSIWILFPNRSFDFSLLYLNPCIYF